MYVHTGSIVFDMIINTVLSMLTMISLIFSLYVCVFL